MPRSFLVKKHINSAKKPNYSELESPTGKVFKVKDLSDNFFKLAFLSRSRVCYFFNFLFWNLLAYTLKSVLLTRAMTGNMRSFTSFCSLYFQCSSRRTSTGASPCLSSPSRRSWARQRTAPSQCGLPATCRCLRSPVTSPPSLDTPHRSPTPPLKTTAALKARGVMKTSRCCPNWQTLTEWRQRNSNVACVASPTPRTLDCSSINSCTATPKRGNPSVVNTARRSTWAWELSKCTSGLTLCLVFAKYAGKLSPDRGCSKDTSGRTPVSEWGATEGPSDWRGWIVVVGFYRHRLIVFNPVRDLIASAAPLDPFTRFATVFVYCEADIVVEDMMFNSQNAITS